MPLPDPHANEPTVEIGAELHRWVQEAREAVEAWQKEYESRKAKLREQIGDAFAATVDGQKVYTNRPKDQYGVSSLIKAYPDLTAHFFEYVTENRFNMEKFKEAHPDIAEKYRVRALVEVKGI